MMCSTEARIVPSGKTTGLEGALQRHALAVGEAFRCPMPGDPGKAAPNRSLLGNGARRSSIEKASSSLLDFRTESIALHVAASRRYSRV